MQIRDMYEQENTGFDRRHFDEICSKKKSSLLCGREQDSSQNDEVIIKITSTFKA
jgi:hypothetical protein